MKIVIADDERLIRYSLRSMLEELTLPVEVVAEAANGEEFISLVERHEPDVAFVDIRMPKLDGLEAIRRLKDRFPATRWILLTSHSDFSYARDAISLDASAYLLKPVSPEELQEQLEKLLREHRRQIVAANRMFENRMTGMFNNTLPADDPADRAGGARRYRGGIFSFDSSREERALAAFQLEFSGKIRRLIEEVVTRETGFALFTLPEGELFVVASWPDGGRDGDPPPGEIVVSRFFRRLFELVEASLQPDLATTFLYGGTVGSFPQLTGCVRRLLQLSAFRVVLGTGGCISDERLEGDGERAGARIEEFCRSLEAFAGAFRDGSLLSFTRCLEEVPEKFMPLSESLSESAVTLLREGSAGFLRVSLGCSAPFEPESPEWKRTLREHGVRIIERRLVRDEESSGIVARIQRFVERNYMHDIGIAQIAQEIGMTPNYLSSLFHRRTGTTFSRFLTKVRMLKAQEALARADIPIREAAALSGYQSTRHFARLFRRTFGLYPSEYRKSLADEP